VPLFLLEVLMVTIDDIHKLATHYEELYSGTRKEQETDLTYIRDNFNVPIKAPHRVFRSGIGRKIADAPAEAIVTSNPQALVEIFKGKQDKQDAGKRISEEINQRWIELFRRQNPNPFKEFVKNLLGRGEAYFKIIHNEYWAKCPECGGSGKIGRDKCEYCKGEGSVDASKRKGLPVRLIVPDSMVVYASPEEYEGGIPKQVIVSYERQLKELIPLYPYLDKIKDKKVVKWLEYYDSKNKYCEADGIPVTDGIEDTIYGCPFIRKYSGLGKRSPDGELAELIVSDLRFQRDMILEECITRSNIASIEFLYAHRGKTVIGEGSVNREDFETAEWGADTIKIFQNAAGVEIKDDEIHEAPPEMYMHLAQVRQDLAQMNPLISIPGGTSGRQDDKIRSYGLARHATVVENTSNAVATMLEKSLQICKVIPDWKPAKLNKGDLDTDYQIRVDLKTPDPVEADRMSLMGRTMVQMGQMSLRYNLIHFQGMTEDEADEEIDEMLAERYMYQSPDIAELMQVRAAEKSGMLEDIQALKARRMELEKKVKEFPLGAQTGSQGGEPRVGNIKSPEGLEQAEYQRGQRGTAGSGI